MNQWQLLRTTVTADLTAMAKLKGRPGLGAAALVDVLALPGTWAVLLFRLAATCHRTHLRPLSRALYFLNVVLFGADLAPGASVGPGLAIGHPVGVGWGKGFTAGSDVIITGMARFMAAGSPDRDLDGEPVLGDGVVVMDGAKVIGRVLVGDGAVLAASALVLADVPADMVVVGQPARVVRSRSEPSLSANRLSVATARVAGIDAMDGVAAESA